MAAPVRPIVICGPSGSGKSTLLKRLFRDFPNRFGFSVSHTTRAPRPGEVDGREYHFVTRDALLAAVDRGEFVESATYANNTYGTSFAAVNDVLRRGVNVILDIDMQGVRLLSLANTQPLYLFIAPPSLEELERRLRLRATETADTLKARLDAAAQEMAWSQTPGAVDRVILNRDVEEAYADFLDALGLTEELKKATTTAEHAS
ncbi:hypothetical protein CXG81DRAFT_9382 [Caulochytrium protostelioides]|uniref:Guanylate kinase n=2 Tax=Caulochytrium protostelioides TaxID=1555241 RepID=A0A4P9XDM3_9FUNG|nr:hypothetical protein CXG81DRAFT_9382 [Caulochytrium protostelioides]|eukprot:RKP03585.1 hypothetical protein CXG81DRAFT_9382 [Caulochytrium protostelioides]